MLESEIQKSVVSLLRLYRKTGKLRFFSVPNEAKRRYKNSQRLKNMGMERGAADLIVMLAAAPRVLWWELKSQKGELTEDQADWRDWLTKHGYDWALIRALCDAEAELYKFGVH